MGLFACFAYRNLGPTTSPGDEVVFGQIITDSGLPPGGGTSKHYLYGYVPPKGVVILKLLI